MHIVDVLHYNILFPHGIHDSVAIRLSLLRRYFFKCHSKCSLVGVCIVFVFTVGSNQDAQSTRAVETRI